MGTFHRYKKILFFVAASISTAYLTGCSHDSASSSSIQASTGTSGAAVVMGKMNVSLLSQGGTVLYSDTVANSSLTLKAGSTYSIKLDVTNMPAGTTYSLVTTRTDIIGATPATQALVPGMNTFTVSQQVYYTLKVVATPPNAQGQSASKYYQAMVSCANPTFTASSLDATKIVATAGGGSNLYNFSAAGITAGANGMAPYTCAFDPTGVGIVDTGFQDCGTALTNFYSNNVSTRNVGVMVKDACNVTVSVSNAVNLAYTEPGMPGNVFIFGQFSNPSGVATNDPRVANLQYLATNTGGHNIVQPNYGGGAFKITSFMNYGMPSSVNFGMEIDVVGITDNLNVSAMTGSISAASASIKAVTFTTDQSGDQAAQVSYSSTSCTLSNQGATVKFTQGQPCSSGTTGDNNMATVEVWGHYVCTSLTTTGGATTVSGDFDGYTNLVDNCSGGGGGGGGIVPIKL